MKHLNLSDVKISVKEDGKSLKNSVLQPTKLEKKKSKRKVSNGKKSKLGSETSKL